MKSANEVSPVTSWHRVFGSLDRQPDPAALCQELEQRGFSVRPAFRGDEAGWFAARLELVPFPVREVRAGTAPIPPLAPASGERGEGDSHDVELQGLARHDGLPHPSPLPPSTGGEGVERKACGLETAPLDSGSYLEIERYLVREEGLRGDLNSWSAWVEAQPPNPAQDLILDALVSTVQFFTLREATAEELDDPSGACLAACKWLARETNGIYQVDGQGFFDVNGNLLLAESAAGLHE